jgi:hypothetical protein
MRVRSNMVSIAWRPHLWIDEWRSSTLHASAYNERTVSGQAVAWVPAVRGVWVGHLNARVRRGAERHEQETCKLGCW